jgi:hypothetical protein
MLAVNWMDEMGMEVWLQFGKRRGFRFRNICKMNWNAWSLVGNWGEGCKNEPKRCKNGVKRCRTKEKMQKLN